MQEVGGRRCFGDNDGSISPVDDGSIGGRTGASLGQGHRHERVVHGERSDGLGVIPLEV